LAISPTKAVWTIGRFARRVLLPAGVLLAGWALSGWLYARMSRDRVQYDESRRDSIVAGVETDLRIRLAIYENVLRSAAADLVTSDHLTNREDWHTYVDRTGLFARYPGTAVVSVIQPVARDHLEDFIAERRRRGSRDFKIRTAKGTPASNAPPAEYLLMICVEPPGIAAQAVGSDLNSLPRRRAAAKRARDEAIPVLASDALQNRAGRGLQLFVPVYRQGSPATTVAERRAALTAWVTVVFSADAFFRSVMRGREAFMDLQLFDGTAEPANLMFSSNPAGGAVLKFERTTTSDLDGARWILGWNRSAKFPYVDKSPSVWAAGSCAALTLLLALLVIRLQSTVQRAETNLAIEQKHGERTQAFLASLVQSSDDSIVGITLDGLIASWNRASEQLWGYTAEEAIGKHLTMVFLPEQKQDFQQVLERIERNERVERLEDVRLKKDGTSIDVSVIRSPIKDSRGQLLGVSAVYSDITQRKQAEAELRGAKEAAEAASRAKSEFLANMSHEIRTPMNGIIGMTDLTLGTDLTEEQSDYLATVKTSAESLLTIINDILDYSKIEAGHLEIDAVSFNLRDQMEETLRTVAVAAHEKGLELVCAFEHDVPEHVVGDPIRLRQILVNLLGNSVKFTQHGEVAVHVDVQKRTRDDLDLHFAVRDTGIGIPIEKQQLIFEPFSQADGSTTRRFGGTGLGLTISARLVAAMNGSVWVESEPDHGSCFHFVVRLGVDSQPTCVWPSEDLLNMVPVLVVDDNSTNRKIHTEMLRGWRMKPHPSPGARDALSCMWRARQDGAPYPIVLTDCHMPEMDGFDLAHEIRRSPHLADTIILMLTSADLRGDLERSREAGISAYLTKPVRRADLHAAIVRALNDRALNDRSVYQLNTPAVKNLDHRRASPAGRLKNVQARPSADIKPTGSRILLAEDNAINQHVVLQILKHENYRIVTAANGREVLERLRHEEFDLILMDVQMPELDGLETTAAIRQAEMQTGGHIPILALTARAMEGDRDRCLRAGMDAYISKPIRAGDLLRLLAQHMPQQVIEAGYTD
jgi:PAS domain S-box-containing protein